MRIICIGMASYDITIPVESYPVENTKNRIKELIECGGGPASNAAYLLGKWGENVSFLGVIGNDIQGYFIKKEFESANVNTKYLEINSSFKTPISHIVANTTEGTRTIFTYRKPMKMKPISLDFKPDIILMDGQEYEMSKKLIERYPEAIKVIDAGRCEGEILELCSLCDYIVCSKTFAEKVSGVNVDFSKTNTLLEIYMKLKNKFKNNIVITLEDRGCLYEKDGKVNILSSLKVAAKDSTGAGDIFHGAFVYGIANNYSFEECLKIANVAGAISCTRIGGRYSVPSKEEVLENVQKHR